MTTLAPLSVTSDAQLWQRSCAGDREAFAGIVERYQTLVCSLAYSACGSLARSEDLAQETFVTAWRRLHDLREPDKLRAWLCGIVRKLSANATRREERRGGPAASLEDVAEPAAREPDPAERAVSEEEAALLWRTLAALPDGYREPLILFYRQEQSTAQVAEALELSEETVRQRLSRGRALLRAELASVVESGLTRSRPGAAFTLAVMVALPLVAATSASAAVVIGGGLVSSGATSGPPLATAAPGMLAKVGLAPFVGPLIGLTFAWFGTRAAAAGARSEEERRLILRRVRGQVLPFCLVLSLGLAAALIPAGRLYVPAAGWIVLGVTAWLALLLGGIFWFDRRLAAEIDRLRLQTGTTDAALASRGVPPVRQGRRYETRARLLGLPLFAFAWNLAPQRTWRERAAVGWIAVGDLAVSPLLAFGGTAVAPIALGGITVGVVSLSIFCGLALGVFALGALAFGGWSLGFAAAGWQAAVGLAAVARELAVGLAASGAQTGAEALAALQANFLADFRALLLHPAWLVLVAAWTWLLRGWIRPEQ
ncbi:MAG: sigma-70 family RNA polymerase sigma factor [Verrucomicrobia bacterium]|nr:sigma-70 family RNA polymerase sigma factor [Verrucomicrobiota bacterium]